MLKRVLAKVISKTQNAFAEGRQILGAVLVANEAIDSILRSNGEAILGKLDIEKAYESMTMWISLFFVGLWRKWVLVEVDKFYQMVHLYY